MSTPPRLILRSLNNKVAPKNQVRSKRSSNGKKSIQQPQKRSTRLGSTRKETVSKKPSMTTLIDALRKEGYKSEDEIEEFLSQDIIDTSNHLKFNRIETLGWGEFGETDVVATSSEDSSYISKFRSLCNLKSAIGLVK